MPVTIDQSRPVGALPVHHPQPVLIAPIAAWSSRRRDRVDDGYQRHRLRIASPRSRIPAEQRELGPGQRPRGSVDANGRRRRQSVSSRILLRYWLGRWRPQPCPSGSIVQRHGLVDRSRSINECIRGRTGRAAASCPQPETSGSSGDGGTSLPGIGATLRSIPSVEVGSPINPPADDKAARRVFSASSGAAPTTRTTREPACLDHDVHSGRGLHEKQQQAEDERDGNQHDRQYQPHNRPVAEGRGDHGRRGSGDNTLVSAENLGHFFRDPLRSGTRADSPCLIDFLRIGHAPPWVKNNSRTVPL